MKFIELFAGIGGFRYGLENVTVAEGNQQRVPERGKSDTRTKYGNVAIQQSTCVYANEFNKYAAQIYEKNYEKPDTRDITKVSSSEVPDHDLLTAGFPCQSFSVAGKRGGFSDTRGTLFFEIARIAKQKQPRLLLLENVKGLLSHDKGKTFGTILNTLDELGYDLQWQVLNSKNFGVPQNRERVFIVGHLRGTSRPEVFPIIQASKEYLEPEFNGKEVRSTRQPLRYLKRNQRNIEGDYAYTVDGSQTNGIKQESVRDGLQIRRLTPTECERLQGFPDGWTEGISDTQRYKCLGNAVTTNVITAIGKKLKEITK